MKRSWQPAALVLLSSTSLQVGLAVAANAFGGAGPMGAVWVRSVVGAALLWLYIRPNIRGFDRAQLQAIVVYAVALSCMTGFVYLAVARAPLGVVSAILMLGPLGIAAWGNRSPIDLALVAVAACGALILSLAQGSGGPFDGLGLGFAVAAAIAFAAYIVAGKRVTQRVEGLKGLAMALVIVALVQTPFGLLFGQPGMWEPSTLGALALAGVLSTLIPFALEMTALRTLSMATFGLLLAFEPGVAAIAGFAIRGDTLSIQQILGIALVIAAAAGTLGPRGWIRNLGTYNRRIMSDPKVQALANVPLFHGLSAAELSSLAQVASERQASVGDVLTTEGDAGDEFFIIADGSVAITQDGRELRRLGPGEYLGEIALVFGGTRTATAVVAEPSRLLVLGKADFADMLKRQPRIEDKILATVSERMRYR